MPEVIEMLIRESKAEIDSNDVELRASGIEDIARNAKFMDRLEDRFFREMRKAIERGEG